MVFLFRMLKKYSEQKSLSNALNLIERLSQKNNLK